MIIRPQLIGTAAGSFDGTALVSEDVLLGHGPIVKTDSATSPRKVGHEGMSATLDVPKNVIMSDSTKSD